MFRKPGAAKRALGILASSRDLANTVEPVRMADGGDVNSPAYTEREQKFLDFAYGYQPKRNPLQEQFERMTGKKYVDPIKDLLMKSALKVQQGLPLEVNGRFISDGNPMRRKAVAAARDSELGTPDPLRMSNGGSARIEQLQQQLNSLIQQRQRLNDIPASSINPLTGAPRVIASGIMERRALAASTLDKNIAQLKQQLDQEMAAVGELPMERRQPDISPRSLRPTLSGRPPVDPRGFSGSKTFEETVVPAIVAATTVEKGKESPIRNARTGGRPPVTTPKEDDGGGFLRNFFSSSAEASDDAAARLQEDNAKELAQKAGVLPAEKKSPEPSTDDLTSALNKLGESSPEKDTSTADLFLRIGLSIAAGQDRNALTNIAAGTLAALQESEKIGLLKDRQRPKIQETLDYFKTAGLNENEVQAILPYALGTTKRDSESERVVADMQAAAQRGDVAALTTILLQQQGQNADTALAREQAEALIEQFSGVGSKN